MDVIVAVSEFKEIAGISFLSISNLLTNSEVICCASPEEPPFPHDINLPELLIILIRQSVADSIEGKISLTDVKLIFWFSIKLLLIISIFFIILPLDFDYTTI